MFEKASRSKLRFETSKGNIPVEDLWDLPLMSTTGKINLDDIAKELHMKLKSGADISFVDKSRKSDDIIQLKFDIVKHIIDAKVKESEESILLKSNKELKQNILNIVAQKENEHLSGLSLDELKKMASTL